MATALYEKSYQSARFDFFFDWLNGIANWRWEQAWFLWPSLDTQYKFDGWPDPLVVAHHLYRNFWVFSSVTALCCLLDIDHMAVLCWTDSQWRSLNWQTYVKEFYGDYGYIPLDIIVWQHISRTDRCMDKTITCHKITPRLWRNISVSVALREIWPKSSMSVMSRQTTTDHFI